MSFNNIFVYKTPFLCNAACKFCLSKAKQIDKKYTYPRKKIIQEFIRIKKRWFDSIILVWGESTIISNVEDYIRIAKILNLELIITTNGIVLSDFAIMKRFHDAGLRNIIFSIHSYKQEEHDFLVWVPWAFELMKKAVHNAHILWFKHISTSTVINSYTQHNLVECVSFFRESLMVNINNFCNLEVSYLDEKDYDSKSELFPSLSILQSEIQRLHKIFFWTKGSIWIQNLPLCAFAEETFYLTHEISWKERYYEDSFDNSEYQMNHRIKSQICQTCKLNSKCKGYFPYFKEADLKKF